MEIFFFIAEFMCPFVNNKLNSFLLKVQNNIQCFSPPPFYIVALDGKFNLNNMLLYNPIVA